MNSKHFTDHNSKYEQINKGIFSSARSNGNLQTVKLNMRM